MSDPRVEQVEQFVAIINAINSLGAEMDLTVRQVAERLAAVVNRWAAFTDDELDWIHAGVDDMEVEACTSLAAEITAELARRAESTRRTP